MANLEISKSGKAVKGKRTTITPRVDLTAMVDLMFLLTTFFILTTSLSELNAADISKPIHTDVLEPYPATRTMTILIGKNRQLTYYLGETEKATLTTGKIDLIEKEIIRIKTVVAKFHNNNPDKHLIVIIKPTKTSTFKDFVDLVDEMKITGVKSYAIDDENISGIEKKFMVSKGM